jgi:Flp pilus assembly protein TadG
MIARIATRRGVGKVPRRRGVAAVEFAVIAILLVFLVLGLIEVSRGLMVNQVLSDAARSGCRVGCQSGKTNQDILDEVKLVLEDNNIPYDAKNVSILVMDKAGDVKNARRGDRVSVTVSVPVNKIYWTSAVFLSDKTTLTETIVMMRQY